MDIYSSPELRPAAVNLRSSGNHVFPINNTTLPEEFSVTKAMPLEIPVIYHLRRPRSRLPQRRRRFLTGRNEDQSSISDEGCIKRSGERKGQNSNLSRDTVQHEDLEGLGVIFIKKEEVDLKFLAREGDSTCKKELKIMTTGLRREEDLIEFLTGLKGRWCSRGKRRKVVDADRIVKALPKKWKLELSLRSRRPRPVIHCRRYVSPSGKKFKSCKDVAFYLKAQFSTDVVDPQSVESLPDAEVKSSGFDGFPDIELSYAFECQFCKRPFDDMKELEMHLRRVHGRTTRTLDFDHLATEGVVPVTAYDISVPPGIPKGIRTMDDLYQNTELILIRKPNAGMVPVNAYDNSVPPGIPKGFRTMDDLYQNTELILIRKPNAARKDTVKSRGEPSTSRACENQLRDSSSSDALSQNFNIICTWCNNELFREPIDAQTQEEVVEFICTSCKDNISEPFNSYLSRSSQ